MAPDRKLPRLVLAASVSALVAVGSGGSEFLGPTATASTTMSPGDAATRRIVWSTRRLGRGGTLDGTLDSLGVDPLRRVELLATVSRYLDLRRLSASTGVAVGRSPAGVLVGLEVRHERDRFLRLQFDSDVHLRVELLRLPIVTAVRSIHGRVESSVAQTLAEWPHGTDLTLAYADIFQWDVDLLTDPRRGDEVRLIYEEQRRGAVPPSLPPFGELPDRAGQALGPGRVLAASYEGAVASSHALWVGANPVRGSYYDADGRPLRKSFLKSPLNYRRISSRFSRGRRHPVTRKVVPHHGVDFAAAAGTPVVATADGVVERAGWDGALGRAVRIRHGSEYVTVYGHFRAIAGGVHRGVGVRQNQVIGYVGSSGRATGPHLHYTVLLRGAPIDPMRMENPPVEPLPPALAPHLEEAKRRWLHRLREDRTAAVVTRRAGGTPAGTSVGSGS